VEASKASCVAQTLPGVSRRGSEDFPELTSEASIRPDALVEYIPNRVPPQGSLRPKEEALRNQQASSPWAPFLIPDVVPRETDPREFSRRESLDSVESLDIVGRGATRGSSAPLTILDASPVPSSHEMAVTGEPSWRVAAMCGSGGSVLVGEEFHPELGDVVACVGNVMLLKRGQQVLLCRYPAYAQMVRVQYFCNRLKSEGDCQQFSSDWQVPLRQEEAFMDSLASFLDCRLAAAARSLMHPGVSYSSSGLQSSSLHLWQDACPQSYMASLTTAANMWKAVINGYSGGPLLDLVQVNRALPPSNFELAMSNMCILPEGMHSSDGHLLELGVPPANALGLGSLETLELAPALVPSRPQLCKPASQAWSSGRELPCIPSEDLEEDATVHREEAVAEAPKSSKLPQKPNTAPPKVPRPHMRKVKTEAVPEEDSDRQDPKRQRDHSLNRKFEEPCPRPRQDAAPVEDSKRARTRPRSLSGAGSGPPCPPPSGLPPKGGMRVSRGGRHRTAIVAAAALGVEVEAIPGSSERVRSHTRHRAAIAEARTLWEDSAESEACMGSSIGPSLRRVQSLPNNAMEKDRSFAGRPKRHQRSLERSIDKT